MKNLLLRIISIIIILIIPPNHPNNLVNANNGILGRRVPPSSCICVLPENCGDSDIPLSPRDAFPNQCPHNKGLRCCFSIVPSRTTTPSSQPTPPPPEVRCGTNNSIHGHGHHHQYMAKFGEFPWLVKIIGRKGQFLGSGALIAENKVLTVAHLFENEQPRSIIMGDWERREEMGNSRPLEVAVSRLNIHKEYNYLNLFNDIALLHLAERVNLHCGNPQVGTVCLPQANPQTNKRCFLSVFGGESSPKIYKLELPIMSHSTCEDKLRTSGLGWNFHLNRKSFLCAGGDPAGDACPGHGGAPLVCEGGERGALELVGLVSWGVGDKCQEDQLQRGRYPGVYTKIHHYLKWISKHS